MNKNISHRINKGAKIVIYDSMYQGKKIGEDTLKDSWNHNINFSQVDDHGKMVEYHSFSHSADNKILNVIKIK